MTDDVRRAKKKKKQNEEEEEEGGRIGGENSLAASLGTKERLISQMQLHFSVRCTEPQSQ